MSNSRAGGAPSYENEGKAGVLPPIPVELKSNNTRMRDGYEVVTFAPNDPEDPKNFGKGKKAMILIFLNFMCFCTAFGSSIWAAAQMGGLEAHFKVSNTVATLGVALYLMGFGAGPLVWGPMSEAYGRKLPYIISWPLFVACNAATGWGNSIALLVVFRFLAGAFGACALNNAGGIIQDVFDGVVKQKASGLFILCAFGGPTFGPLVGSFTAVLASWEWSMKVLFIFSAALLPCCLLLPETLGTTILAKRSARMRKETGRQNIFALHELNPQPSLKVVKMSLLRPMQMLGSEPISIMISAYLAIAYSILYVVLYAWGQTYAKREPFISQPQKLGLVYLAQFIGMMVGLVLTTPLSAKLATVNFPLMGSGEGRVGHRAEDKVKLAIPAAIFVTASQFWWAFTSNNNHHYMVSVVSGFFFGFGFIQVFLSFVVYGMEVYGLYTSSFLAASALSRSVIAGVFSLVVQKMLENLGHDWTVAMMAFFSLALLPVPFIFVRYGSSLERRSALSQEAKNIAANMHASGEETELDVAVTPATVSGRSYDDSKI